MFSILIINLFVAISAEDVGEPLFVTSYLENGQITTVQKLAKVTLKDAENITSYSGLFTVNKKYDSNLFFWYFTAEEQSETAPVLLWLNGGPGTTSLMGLFDEHGPFYVNAAMKLQFRQYYWTKNHHVIYLDNPVGVGYSFTRDDRGFAHNARDTAVNIHEALVQFFQMFPNLRNHAFYVTGESYGGKYVPALSSVILERQQIGNFKGVAIVNGLTHPVVQMKGFGEYLYQQGFLDSQQKAKFVEMENRCVEGIRNNHAIQLLLSCPFLVHPFNSHTLFRTFTGYDYTYNILEDWKPHTSTKNRENFVQLPEVRRSIHIGNLTRSDSKMLLKVQLNLGLSQLASEKEHIEQLLNQSYPVLLFSGQLDVQIPYIMMANYIKELQFPQAAEYKRARRQIWRVADHVAGYVKQAGSLTEVMVIGAGHAVPVEQPQRAFDLITRFTHLDGKFS